MAPAVVAPSTALLPGRSTIPGAASTRARHPSTPATPTPLTTPPAYPARCLQIRMSLLPLRTCQRLWGRDRMTNKSSSPPIIYNILSNFFKNNMLCAADAGEQAPGCLVAGPDAT